MTLIDRRTVLASGALALTGVASVPAAAQAGPKPLFPVPAVTIPIVGETEVFPVRRIYCIGRNYAAHAREMGSDPTREPPFFFQKPTDAIQNVATERDCRSSLSSAHEKLPLRDRTGRCAQKRRPRYFDRPGARPCTTATPSAWT